MSGAPDPAVGDGDGPGQVLDTVAWVLPYKILLGVVAVLALTFFSLPVVLLLGGMLSAGGADGLPLLLVVPAVLWTAVGVLFAACALRAIGLGMVITTEGVQVRSYLRRRWYPWGASRWSGPVRDGATWARRSWSSPTDAPSPSGSPRRATPCSAGIAAGTRPGT